MDRPALTFTTALALMAVLGACASVHSRKLAKGDEGLVYYLPTQALVLTLVVAKDPKDASGKTLVRAMTLTPSAAMADRSAGAFLLRYRLNQAGTNLMNVAVGSNGLLDGASNGSTTSEISGIIKGMAGSAAALHALDGSTIDECDRPGSYEWIVLPRPPEKNWEKCLLLVNFIDSQVDVAHVGDGHDGSAGYGFFYRQALPIPLAVTDRVRGETTHFFPSITGEHSPLRFLPIPRTLFANVEWKVTMDDGSPTLYNIKAGGELQGLISLPADVIAAYSTAVTAGFDREKKEMTEQSAYLSAMMQLARDQARATACNAAVETGDLGVISAACVK